MKVKPINSYFGKASQSSSQSPPNTPPPTIDVPSRRPSKKAAKKPEPDPVSEEEDPLPRDVRDKAKKSKKRSDTDGAASKKRKARVLSDSEEEDDFKPDKKTKDKDKEKEVVVDKKKVVKEEPQPPKKNVDPADFFSREKVKREKAPEKVEEKQIPPSKREKRESPQKKNDATPEKASSSKRDNSKSPEKPVKQETSKSPKPSSSSHKPSSPDKSPKKGKESPKSSKPLKVETLRSSPRKHSSSRSNQKRKSIPLEDSSDSDSETDFNPKKKKSSSGSKTKTTYKPTVTKTVVTNSPPKATPEPKKPADPKRALNYGKYLARMSAKPRHLGEKRIPTGTPDCLEGLTFVITGILESLEREACKTLVEKHGGRVTTGISKKTTHLIVGDDSGESKIKKAEELKVAMINEDQLLEMIRISNPDGNNNEEVVEMMDLGDEDDEEPVPAAIKKESKKKSSKSPTKREDSPVKKKEVKQESSKSNESNNNNKTDQKQASIMPTAAAPAPSLMWVDKHRPKLMKHIVGQLKDNSNAKKLVRWLTNWFNHHGKSTEPKAKPAGPFFKDPEGKTFKCALLSGLPGIGKTTTAHLACKEVGYDYFEMNASDTRNKKGLHEHVSDALSCQTMFGGINDLTKKHVLIMDEVDGMSGNEDRGGVQELITLIKSSRVPIICICNDRNHPKIRSLANYCFDLRFVKPTLQELKGFIASISFKENLKIDPARVNQLCISADFDVRQILHQLELYKESSAVEILNPKKDLKFGPWDVCRKVFSISEHEHMNIHERNGLFFQDYNIGSLFVQENYAKWIPARAKQNKHARLELIARTAASIAEGDLTETTIRRTNNWGLLPVQAIFSSYVPGQLMESNITGGIEFPKWLGKNSSKNKHHRQLQSLHTHVHLEVSASLEALNMDYLPYLRRKICNGITSGDVEAAVAVMETHSLIRDDFEAINELTIWPGMINPFERVDSKLKAAFTRLVNKEVLPYSCAKPVIGKKKGTGGGDDYGDDEEEEEVVEDPEEEEKPEKDGMIKMKKKPASNNKKKSDKDEDGPGPSKAKKSRKK